MAIDLQEIFRLYGDPRSSARHRKMYYFAYHQKKLTDDFVRLVMKTCAPKSDSAGHFNTAEDYERWLKISKAENFLNGIGDWKFPVLVTVADGAIESWAPAVFTLNQRPFYVSLSRMVEIPTMLKESRAWMSVNSKDARPYCTTQYGAEWFMDKFRPTVPLFEPEFAFADNDLAIMQNLDKKDVHPKELAWPLMIYGPTEVKRIGQEKLLSAPVWKAEKLPYGGIWLQLAENPFDVPASETKELARYLGLVARTLRVK